MGLLRADVWASPVETRDVAQCDGAHVADPVPVCREFYRILKGILFVLPGNL